MLGKAQTLETLKRQVAALETQPLYHVVSQLVYACGRQQVSDVWIAGHRKLDRRVLVDLDTDALIANARQWRDRIAAVRTAPAHSGAA